ncbi:hypothetical protein RchiOBHm_Chr4g0434591 [Rosa chinensis]|nr:hypothetical protein RchiOBHm_Chr4g0434591 [Rosa chinensis]
MVVTEGDEEGKKIAAMVREIGASELVLGLHDHSFLYNMVLVGNGDPIWFIGVTVHVTCW